MNTRDMTGVLFTLAVSLALSSNAAERVFRWVKADGSVHYGQHPPPNVKAEAIKVEHGYTETEPAEPAEPTAEDKAAAERKASCDVATKNFEMLGSDSEVRRRDEYGEVSVMTPEQRETERERASQAMNRFCTPSAPEDSDTDQDSGESSTDS